MEPDTYNSCFFCGQSEDKPHLNDCPQIDNENIMLSEEDAKGIESIKQKLLNSQN